MASKQSKSNHHQGFKVFVGGLSVNCEDKELREYLQRFGPVLHCSINRDQSGYSKGYAFATFRHQKDQQKSIGKYHVIRGKPFEIRILVDSEKNAKLLKEIAKRKVFISNLKENITEDDISKHFVKFGAIEEVLISRDPATQQSKGFGFVVFQRIDSVDNILKGKQKRVVKVNNHDVIVREAIPKMEIDIYKKDHEHGHEEGHDDDEPQYEEVTNNQQHATDLNKDSSMSDEKRFESKVQPNQQSAHSQNYGTAYNHIQSKNNDFNVEQGLRESFPQESSNLLHDGGSQQDGDNSHRKNTHSKMRDQRNNKRNPAKREKETRKVDSLKKSQEQQFYTNIRENLGLRKRDEYSLANSEFSLQSSNISSLDSLRQSPLLSNSHRIPEGGVQGYYISTLARKESLNLSADPRKRTVEVRSLPLTEGTMGMPANTSVFIPKKICLCGIDSLQNKEDSNIVHFMNSKRCTCKPDSSQFSDNSKWYADSAGFETQATSNCLSRSLSFNNYENNRPRVHNFMPTNDYDPLHGFSLSSSKYKLLSRDFQRDHQINYISEQTPVSQPGAFDDYFSWYPEGYTHF